MRDSNTDFEASERYVYKTEADRNAFHCQHFGADWTNPTYYDLTVNTGYMGIEGAIAAIKAAFAVWKDLHYKEDSATHET